MLRANTDAAVASLANFEIEMKRKLEGMVERFVIDVGSTAIEKTPLGDEIKFASLYKWRNKVYNLAEIRGFAKGSWKVSATDDLVVQELYSGDAAAKLIQTEAKTYKLGQTVYISNVGPYIGILNNPKDGGGFQKGSPQAPEGITKPTLSQVQAVYRADLPNYYKAS